MFICDRCGNLCDDDDLPTYTEDFGYDTGVGFRSCPQTFIDNCSCGGDYVEAEQCCCCNEYFNPDDLENGCCSGCLEENATFEMALKIGKDNPEKVEINGFYAWAFTTEEIETILKRELDSALKLTPQKIKDDAKKYCLEDKYCLAEYIDKEN